MTILRLVSSRTEAQSPTGLRFRAPGAARFYRIGTLPGGSTRLIADCIGTRR